MAVPLALMGAGAAGKMALGMTHGSNSTTTAAAGSSKFDDMLKQEMIQKKFASNPTNLVGKTVQVKGADGNSITGKVASVQMDKGAVVLQVQGKSFHLGDVQNVSS